VILIRTTSTALLPAIITFALRNREPEGKSPGQHVAAEAMASSSVFIPCRLLASSSSSRMYAPGEQPL